MGGVFYLGTLIVVETGINISDAFMSIFLCYMSTVGAGILLSNAPNVSRAQEAANTIFGIINEKSKIDSR